MRWSIALLAAALALAAPAAAQVTEAASSSVLEEDVTWARRGEEDLLARIYRQDPADGDLKPALVDVHGGAWNLYDRTSGAHYDRALAEAGFVVVAIDFRQGPDHQHPAGSDDVADAVRWLRANAAEHGVDPDRIGLIGSSSGGHLALLAGLRPGGTDAAESATVDFIVALWPVSDPHARYRYAQRAGLDRLVEFHDAYFANEAAMREASVPRLVTAGEAVDPPPPLLIVQPGMDSNIPVEMTFDLIRAYQARDGHVEYAFYPGMPHAFGHRDSPETADMIALVTDFARRGFAK